MACVAFPTCGLAMAEAERYLPSLLDKIELIIDEAGLLYEKRLLYVCRDVRMVVLVLHLGEIAFIGKSPGKYNMYLGAGFAGDRLNKIIRENIGEEEILELLQATVSPIC